MQKRALAARDAHLALLDLGKLVDGAARTAHATELEAVHLANNPRHGGGISGTLRLVVERLESADFAATLAKVSEKLQTVMS